MEESSRTAGTFDASRALANSTQFNLAQETASKKEADVLVKQLEDAIRAAAEEGTRECKWTIPGDRDPSFNLTITRKAVRHFLRYNGYWWTQDVAAPNEYVVRWEAQSLRDYLIGNNWDSRYKWIPF